MVFEDKYGLSFEMNSDIVICKFLNSGNMIEMNKCAQEILKKNRDHFLICCVRNTVFLYNLITVSEIQVLNVRYFLFLTILSLFKNFKITLGPL